MKIPKRINYERVYIIYEIVLGCMKFFKACINGAVQLG